MYEAIIIGGGPAGLQAALTLGRMHRRTLLLDSREYRNATVDHAHNLLGNDGVAPADLRARGREELAAYATLEIRDATASGVAADAEGVRVEVDGETLHAGHLVLATGLADDLPPSPDSRSTGATGSPIAPSATVTSSRDARWPCSTPRRTR